ncbi:MAG: hypothetical protein QXK90_02230, partial [Candidatus Parvarchaeota archaeon]
GFYDRTTGTIWLHLGYFSGPDFGDDIDEKIAHIITHLELHRVLHKIDADSSIIEWYERKFGETPSPDVLTATEECVVRALLREQYFWCGNGAPLFIYPILFVPGKSSQKIFFIPAT